MDIEKSGSSKPSKMSDDERVPKRDYWILPFISFVTVLTMLGLAEISTRIIWSAHEENSCVVLDGSPVGYHFKPNCTAESKSPEGPWATYHFNECGYRSASSCGAVPSGVARIAIIGSSVSQGLNIPYEDTYFAISSVQISRACKKTVDVQNLGLPHASPLYAYRQVEQALALKPDVVLLLLAPFDLEQQIDRQALLERNDPIHTKTTNAVIETQSVMRKAQLFITSSRTLLVAEHFVLKNKETFLRLYLNYGDKADFLRQPLTPAWDQRFSDLDVIIGDMASKIRAAGIPFVVMPVPSRAESALLSSRNRPQNIDPFAFGKRLEESAAKHGAEFVDLMEPFSQIPDSQNLFFIVDGHVAPEGQRVMAKELTKKLMDGTVAPFQGCNSRSIARLK